MNDMSPTYINWRKSLCTSSTHMYAPGYIHVLVFIVLIHFLKI